MLGIIKPRLRRTALVVTVGAVLAAGAAILLPLSSPADAAANVSCGQTITTSITITNDLTCNGIALRIGASGITVNLGGHTLSVGSNPPAFSAGVVDYYDYSNVTITNGTIKGFTDGVLIAAGATAPTGTHLQNLRVVGTQIGFEIEGSAAVVSGNVLVQNGWGVIVDASSTTVNANSLAGNQGGIAVEAGGTNVISANRIASSTAGNGIEVASGAHGTKITNNVVTASAKNGMAVNDVTATITGNTTNFNAVYGIAGSYGPVDGGNNKARDNVQAKQCTIVTCL